MKKSFLITFFLLFSISFSFSQSPSTNNNLITVDIDKVKEDLEYLLTTITNYYSYLEDQEVDINCIRNQYRNKVHTLKTKEDVTLFFEFLLMEFHDNHMFLSTNNRKSYRLFAPIYVALQNNKIVIKNVFQTQIEKLDYNIIGAEVLKINGVIFSKAISLFPTKCSDKNSSKIKEWIANKIIFGKYNEARILTLKLSDHTIIELDVDKIKVKEEKELLSVHITNNIGIIRVNNSLGENSSISEFDKALDTLLDTKGLILDLRNTYSGGNSYVAKGIISRFIDKDVAYQKHSYIEKYDGKTAIKRSWVEFVSPRGKCYNKKVVVLVGKWTGSMGEGLTIGFDNMKNAKILGTEMKKLLGAIEYFPFKNRTYGFKFPIQRLFHVNGTPREKFVPKNYIKQLNSNEDEVLKRALLFF